MSLLRKPHRGQTLVEFALLLPILLLIVLVTIDLGRAVYYYSVVFNAAREGARYGIIHPDDTAGIEAAARALAIGLEPGSLTITSNQPTWYTIRVTAAYQFQAATPLFGVVTGSNQIMLQSSATMRVEQ